MFDLAKIFDAALPALFGSLFGGVSAYVAIRSELARLNERTKLHGEEIARAHARIDDVLNRH